MRKTRCANKASELWKVLKVLIEQFRPSVTSDNMLKDISSSAWNLLLVPHPLKKEQIFMSHKFVFAKYNVQKGKNCQCFY